MPFEIKISPDSPYIYHPRFVDEARQRIKAIARLPDGRLVELEGHKDDASSRFIREVFAQYSPEEIQAFTERDAKMARLMKETQLRVEEDRKIEQERAATVQAKAAALALPAVQADVALSRQIRQAKTAFEVTALTAAALLKALGAERVAVEAREGVR